MALDESLVLFAVLCRAIPAIAIFRPAYPLSQPEQTSHFVSHRLHQLTQIGTREVGSAFVPIGEICG